MLCFNLSLPKELLFSVPCWFQSNVAVALCLFGLQGHVVFYRFKAARVRYSFCIRGEWDTAYLRSVNPHPPTHALNALKGKPPEVNLTKRSRIPGPRYPGTALFSGKLTYVPTTNVHPRSSRATSSGRCWGTGPGACGAKVTPTSARTRTEGGGVRTKWRGVFVEATRFGVFLDEGCHNFWLDCCLVAGLWTLAFC